MSTERILIHGTTAQRMATTPSLGQIGSDDDTGRVILGDGTTPGGIEHARLDDLPPESQLLPVPDEGDAGKVLVVNAAEDGFELADGGGSAENVSYDNTASGLEAATVQGAIDELADREAFPAGGTTGQVLAKASATDGDVAWKSAFLPRGYISGLIVSNNTSDATNDLDFSAGVAASDGMAPTLMTLATAMTKRLDGNWVAGSGNGGLDTGSPANGWYYAYMIGKSTDEAAVDVLLSASPTSPTMPSGWDLKRLILPFWRDAGAIRPFTQRGNVVTWVTPVEALNTTSASTVGALVTIAAPPISSVQATIRTLLSNGGITNAWVRDTTQINDAASLSNSDMATTTSSARSLSMKSVFVNSSSQIRYRSDTASIGALVITCEGFTFPRGAA